MVGAGEGEGRGAGSEDGGAPSDDAQPAHAHLLDAGGLLQGHGGRAAGARGSLSSGKVQGEGWPPNRGGCCVVRVGSGPRRPGRSRSEATRSFPGFRFPAKAIPRRSVSACSGMGKALAQCL